MVFATVRKCLCSVIRLLILSGNVVRIYLYSVIRLLMLSGYVYVVLLDSCCCQAMSM